MATPLARKGRQNLFFYDTFRYDAHHGKQKHKKKERGSCHPKSWREKQKTSYFLQKTKKVFSGEHLEDDVVVVDSHASLRVHGIRETRKLVDVAQSSGVGCIHSRGLTAKHTTSKKMRALSKNNQHNQKKDNSSVEENKRGPLINTINRGRASS